jgi:hypothetical protein
LEEPILIKRRIKMSDTVKPKKRWMLTPELAVLICIVCILVIKLVIPNIKSTEGGVFTEALPIRPNIAEKSDKARENPRDFDELHSFSSPNNDNTTKSEPEPFGLVTGICYSRDKASAVINNKTIVYEGDTIDGVTIVKIHKDKVEFTKNGKNWALKIIRFP